MFKINYRSLRQRKDVNKIGILEIFVLISQVVHGRKRYLALPSEINAPDSRRVIADHYNFHRPLEVTGDWQNSLSSYAFDPRD